MSRRKQSNPKPFKSGEEDTGEDHGPRNGLHKADEGQGSIGCDDGHSTNQCNGIGDDAQNSDQSERRNALELDPGTPDSSFSKSRLSRHSDVTNTDTDDEGPEKESRNQKNNNNNNNNNKDNNYTARIHGDGMNGRGDYTESLKLKGILMGGEKRSHSPIQRRDEDNGFVDVDTVTVKSEPLSPSRSEGEEDTTSHLISTENKLPSSSSSSLLPSSSSSFSLSLSGATRPNSNNNNSIVNNHRSSPPNILTNAQSSHHPRSNYRRSRSRSRSQSRSDSNNHFLNDPALSPEAAKAKMKQLTRQEAEISLVNHLQLPSDVLYLKQQDMNIHGTPSVGWVVCCAIPLPQGSSLGPFQGQLVSPKDVKVGDLIVQLTNKRGRQALINVAGQSGGWLALLRTPSQGNDRNTQVYWEGGRIWCEIVSDIEVGQELRATFSFQNDDDDDDDDDDESEDENVDVGHRNDDKMDECNSDVDVGGSVDNNNIPDRTVSPPAPVAVAAAAVANASNAGPKPPPPSQPPQPPPPQQQQQPQPPPQQSSTSGHAALIYGCPFCGVRFSSPRTLQGHLSFYCSKKTSDLLVNPASKEGSKGNNSGNSHEVPSVKREPSTFLNDDNNERTRTNSLSKHNEESKSPRLHSPNTQNPVDLKCQYCPYTCDKMASLHRHMRIHNTSKSPPLPVQTSNTSILVDGARSKDRNAIGNDTDSPAKSGIKASSADTFCNECRIQFSSSRTYQCHKEHYCAQRRNRCEARGVAPPEPSPFAAMFYPRILFPDEISKVGIPSALQMAALSQGGLIIPGHPSFLSPQMEISASAANSAASAAVAAAAASMFLGAPVLSSSGALTPMIPTTVQTSASITASSSTVNSDDPALFTTKMKNNKDLHSIFHSPYVNSSPTSPLSPPTSSSSTSHNHFYLSAMRRERSKTPERKQRETRLDSLKGLRNAERELILEEREAIQTGVDTDAGDLPLDLTKPKQSSSPTAPKQRSGRTMTSPFPDKSRHAEEYASRNARSTSPNLSPHYPAYPPSSPFRGSTLSPTYIKVESDSQSPKTLPASQTASRSESISPKSVAPVQLFPHHPSVIISPGQIIPGLSPMSISPTSKMSMAAAASASMSKCTDCNIVFYKHDNYIVHKRHYCSGKRRAPAVSTAPQTPDNLEEEARINSNESSRQHSPVQANSLRDSFKIKEERELRHSYTVEKSPSPKTNPSTSSCAPSISPKSSENAPCTSAVPNEIRYKYYCVPCKIKFSNASILNAHKEYYCPSGKHSEQSIVMQSPEADVSIPAPNNHRDSPESSPEEFPCTRCNTIFTSSRLLRLHVCNGGFPCPHCDHVAITENRRAEHLKVHAPTRAFRCTICGYRGNTFRGMRMHGKTHIDEGLDFTDENMLEYHEPALMPVVATESADPNTDSELLRIKNEPYKRRRSRKAYEKFDFPLPKVDVPQTCPLCGQTFVNSDFLSSHFKVHEIAASQYLAGLMKCIHCDYVGKSASDLRTHFEVTHTRQSRKRERSPTSTTTHADEDNTSRDSPRPIRLSDSPQRKRMVITDPNSPEDNKDALRFIVDSNTPHARRSSSPQRTREESPMVDVQSETPIDSDDNDDRRRHYISRSPSPEFSRQANHFLYAPSQENKASPKREDSSENAKLSPKSDTSTNPPILSIFDPRSPNSSRVTSPEQQRRSPETEILTPTSNTIKTEQTTPEHPQSPDQAQPDASESDISHDPERNLSEHDSHLLRRQSMDREKEPSNHSLKMQSNHEQHTVIKHEASSPSPTGHDRPHSSAPRSPEPANAPITPTPAIPEGLVLPPNNIIFHPNHAQFPYRHAFPYMFLSPPGISASLPSTTPSSHDPRAIGSVGGSHYCQFCDISFSKQATYLAHKKYYCSGAPRVSQSKSSAQA